MNQVFQEFVTVALREALKATERTFGERWIPSLDEEGRIHLKPDLVWRDAGAFVFVGDAKYKRIRDERIPNADLYQLLAYTTALDLPGGLLIYAEDEDERESASYMVRNADKRLEVVALDLSGTLEQVLGRVKSIAARVRALRGDAPQARRAA